MRKSVQDKAIYRYIAAMALGLFVNSYFKVYAAASIPAVKLYPLNQGAALMISSVMAATAFKEKNGKMHRRALACLFRTLYN